MADMSVSLVKELRERTGAGMMECKKALINAHWDIQQAIDNMRKSGQAKADKKSGRLTAAGLILATVSKNNQYGVIIELNCETDFVARDGIFQAFGHHVIATALNERIADLHRIRVQCEEQRIDLVTRMGENINIRRLGILEGNVLGCYLHGSRIGVIVSAVNADEELVKHLAMHIAASKPEYVNSSNVPDEVIAREYKIQRDIALQSNKPRDIAKKMVEGRMRKFIEEVSLTGQEFIMDSSKTVGQLLHENHAQVNNFIRFELGEGIEQSEIANRSEIFSS